MTQSDFGEITKELVGGLLLCGGENGNPEHWDAAVAAIRDALHEAWNAALEEAIALIDGVAPETRKPALAGGLPS